MKQHLRRTAIILGIATTLVSVSALAAEPLCEGKGGKGKAHRFQKADSNGDGFLTKAEVGEKRWERLKAADGNNDARVSKAEFEQFKAKKRGAKARQGA